MSSVFSNPSGSSQQDIDGYIKALLDLVGDRDPRTVLGETDAALRALTSGVAPERLRAPEKPGKWSVVQVLQHLADAELIWAWRSRMAVAHDRPAITPYDQDRWAERLHYDQATFDEAMEQFSFLRALNLRFADRLTPDERARAGLHAERGEESIDRMMRMAAAHDLMHLRQVRRILGVS